MSFTDDINDADYRRDVCCRRPATTIIVAGPNDEEIQRIELPELNLTRAECSPEWLAMVELEAETPKEQR